MSALFSSVDATSKRWLAVLAGAILAAILVLTHSFIVALSPSQETVTLTPSQPPIEEEQPLTAQAPLWSTSTRSAIVENQSPAPAAASPKSDMIVGKKDNAADRELLHRQAEYLRKMAANNKSHDGFNKLTRQQIDEMEKNGIGVW